MFARVRAALSTVWPGRRVPQSDESSAPATSSAEIHPSDIIFNRLDDATRRVENAERVIRFKAEISNPTRTNTHRPSLAQSWRKNRAFTSRRFKVDRRNSNLHRLSPGKDTPCRHSLVKLFKPTSPDSPRCREQRRRFLAENPLPEVEPLNDEETVLRSKEWESHHPVLSEHPVTLKEEIETPSVAPESPVLRTEELESHHPAVSEATVPFKEEIETPSVAPESPVLRTQEKNPIVSETVSVKEDIETPSVAPELPVSRTEERHPVVPEPTISVKEETEASSVIPEKRVSEGKQPETRPPLPKGPRPVYKWPTRRKRTHTESAAGDDSVDFQTPKRSRFAPPHRGQLLSPIGEESESALKAERGFQVPYSPDIGSDPENTSPCNLGQGQGTFDEYLTGGPRQSHSEPPEECSHTADPMDLDGDSFNADVARVNAGLYDPLPGTSSPQLPSSSSSKKRKSKGQDGDAAFVPERQGVRGADTTLSDDDSDFDIPVPPRERRGIVNDFSREKARRLATTRGRHDDSWGEAEKRLDSRLSMLGFEPLMPGHWQFDFRTLPGSLFGAPEDGSEPVIRASGGAEFHATRSLTELFTVGGRVRDCKVLNIRSETVIRRGIRNHLRWAIRDGGVRVTPDATPVYAICCQRRGETALSVLERLDRRLKALGRRFGTGQPHPVLVGFAVCGPICAIVTHDTNPDRFGMEDGHAGSHLKYLCQLDMSNQAQDVWNSLSLAIAVSHIRETMAELAAHGAGGFRLGDGGDEGEDEDL